MDPVGEGALSKLLSLSASVCSGGIPELAATPAAGNPSKVSFVPPWSRSCGFMRWVSDTWTQLLRDRSLSQLSGAERERTAGSPNSAAAPAGPGWTPLNQVGSWALPYTLRTGDHYPSCSSVQDLRLGPHVGPWPFVRPLCERSSRSCVRKDWALLHTRMGDLGPPKPLSPYLYRTDC